MPTVSQASLRDEFARLTGDFGTLSVAGKVTAETAMLMGAEFMLLGVMVPVFLEKTMRKTSTNFGLPPSQTGPDESATTPRSRSKGSGGLVARSSSRSRELQMRDRRAT